MEVRFSTDAESPHYLAQFVFSRAGDAVLLEVTDQRNTQKCAALIPLNDFREGMAFLGCVKAIAVEETIRLKDF